MQVFWDERGGVMEEMVLWGGKTIGAQPWNLATRAGIIPDYYLHGAMVNLGS